MSKLRLTGETSGYVELASQSVANNNTLKLPDSGDTLVSSDFSGNVNIAGIVTATSFSGNITGTATTATTATVSQGLIGTPNINVGVTTVTGLGGVAYVAISTVGTSSSKLLVNREYVTAVGVGTQAGISITLPASPSPGWEVGVAIAGTFTDTVINRNGSNIMSLAENLTLDTAYISVQLVYVNSTVGWRFF